jgi:hypothetical protein
MRKRLRRALTRVRIKVLLLREKLKPGSVIKPRKRRR